jgi:hypothetical protein
MSRGEQGGAARGRTAIVVCAGVGDNSNGQAAARTMQGLVRYGGFTSATLRTDAYAAEPEQPQDLYGYTLTSADGAEVDLYEFWWADLSRFPAAMRLYLVALYGLVLQLPATGIAALRGGGPLTAAPAADSPTPWSAKPVAWIEWLIAVPLVLVSVLEAALIGGFAAVAWTDSEFKTAPELASGIVLAAYGVAVFVVGWWWLRRYRLDRGRYGAVGFGAALFGLVAVVAGAAGVAGHGMLAGLADSLLVLVAFVVRPIWIAVGAAMVALLAGLVVSGDWWGRRRETSTALSAVTTSTAGFALLTGALLAAAGAAVRGLAPGWEQNASAPWCLTRGTSWWPTTCRQPAGADPWHWGLELYTLLLSPLIWVGVLAVAVAAYTAVVTFGPAKRGFPWWPVKAPPAAARRGVETIELRLGGIVMQIVLTAALAASGLLIILSWLPIMLPIPGAGRNGDVPAVAAFVGALILALVGLTRTLNITASAVGHDSPGNETSRLVLDKAYDVATFLREPARTSSSFPDPRPSARERILHRYAALLRHLVVSGPPGRRYSHVVFLAHSQGAVLTATILAEELPAGTSVDLITIGCPLRQLYLRRFPSQFAWVDELRTNPRGFVHGVTGSWANITGSADPIGGPLFADFPPEWWSETGAWNDEIGGVKVAELPVIGGHGGYWSCAPVFRVLGDTAAGRS